MVPIKEALTFDDVTLVPKYSEILPSDVDTSIKLTKNLKLKIPMLSSAMDTVTESKMAIAMAKAGGIGVIHRNLSISKQIEEIKKLIDSSKKGISKYKKEKPEKKDYQLSNGTISFLQYKKINLINDIINLYQSDCEMAENNLVHRLDWIKALQEHIHYLEKQKNLREEKILTLSKLS